MRDNQNVAIISENLNGEGYIVTFHTEFDTPAHSSETYSTIEEIKTKYYGYTWKKPAEDDEVSGEVVLIGL